LRGVTVPPSKQMGERDTGRERARARRDFSMRVLAMDERERFCGPMLRKACAGRRLAHLAAIAATLYGLSIVGCGGGHKHKRTPTPTPSPVVTSSATATHAAATATVSATPTPTVARTSTATASATPTATFTPGGECAVGPVDTTVGVVCGTTATVGQVTADAYLGIPYAEDTSGPNRWQGPTAKARMSGIFQATSFGPICPQAQTSYPAVQSEDCLSVNVWAPSTAGPTAALPVMVFIHGGAFLASSSKDPTYDGAYLSATQNVVVVTLNYRLGALGFLAGIGGLQGNYGLLDQQAAMQWVAANIGKFGGDASRVMLFGESAGGMSVGLHLLSVPSSADLFSAALIESDPLALPYKTLDQATTFATLLQTLLGCEIGGVDCLRSKSAADIVAEQVNPLVIGTGLLSGFSGFLVWAPVVDGSLVTQQPLTAATANGLPKPTLFGTVQNEGTLFVYMAMQVLNIQTISASTYETLVQGAFGSNANAILQVYPSVSGDNAPVLSTLSNDYIFFCASRALGKAPGSPRYAYLFTQPSTFNVWAPLAQCDAPMVCHSAELPYVFHTATNIGYSFTADEEAVSQAMVGYWSGFSRPGSDPNTAGSTRPTWPAFPGFEYQILGTPIQTAVDPPHNCDLWDRVGYESLSAPLLLGAGEQ
jgi:carboxylesterase type B